MRSGNVGVLVGALLAMGGPFPEHVGSARDFSYRVAEIQDEDEKRRALANAETKRARKASVRRLNDLLTKRRNVVFFNAASHAEYE